MARMLNISKNYLLARFNNKTSLQVEKILIELFEGLNFQKTKSGAEKFKKELEKYIPNIDKQVARGTFNTGNGVIEIIEDHYHF